METNSSWFLENIDANSIFCPQKLGAGAIGKHVQKKYKKGEYIYIPNEQKDC